MVERATQIPICRKEDKEQRRESIRFFSNREGHVVWDEGNSGAWGHMVLAIDAINLYFSDNQYTKNE